MDIFSFAHCQNIFGRQQKKGLERDWRGEKSRRLITINIITIMIIRAWGEIGEEYGVGSPKEISQDQPHPGVAPPDDEVVMMLMLVMVMVMWTVMMILMMMMMW